MRATHAGALMPHLPPPSDPSVVLLVHPDDAGGIVDRSQYAHTLSVALATVSSSVPPPSNDLAILNSSLLGSLLEADASAEFARTANEPFTIEFSMRIDTALTLPDTGYFMAWDDGRYHVVTPLGANLYRVNYVDGSGQTYGDLLGGVWYQMAVSYDAFTMRLFVDGVLVDSASKSTAALAGSRKYGILSVPERADLQRFTGMLAEVRLTIGQARYLVDYTPATAPFPNPSAP